MNTKTKRKVKQNMEEQTTTQEAIHERLELTSRVLKVTMITSIAFSLAQISIVLSFS